MNTSKSLRSILEKHYLWAVKNVEHGIYIPLPSPETEAAIVEAVEGLLPPVSRIGKQYSTSEIDRYTYDFAFNQCRKEVLQAIKEWQ